MIYNSDYRLDFVIVSRHYSTLAHMPPSMFVSNTFYLFIISATEINCIDKNERYIDLLLLIGGRRKLYQNSGQSLFLQIHFTN